MTDTNYQPTSNQKISTQRETAEAHNNSIYYIYLMKNSTMYISLYLGLIIIITVIIIIMKNYYIVR